MGHWVPFGTIRAQAHALKSASANLGAVDYSAQWKDIETEARGGTLPADAVTRAIEGFESVRAALTILRASASRG